MVCEIHICPIKRLKFSFTNNYQALYDGYDKLQKLFFEYAVVERTEVSISFVSRRERKDILAGNTLSDVMVESVNVNTTADGCDNTHEIGISLIIFDCYYSVS